MANRSAKNNKMRALDLFSGIGGISLALSPYAETVAYCEFDKHAQAVLLSRMETNELDKAPIWDDIKTLTAETLEKEGIVSRGETGSYEGIDLIAGGFPCQDISVAGGRGAGLEGKRSGLFFEIVRLIKVLNPEFVFLENVPAIRTRGLATVLSEIAAAGYDCRYGFLSAADVGAPHRRERWFLLARRREERPEDRRDDNRWKTSKDAGNDASLPVNRWSSGDELADAGFQRLEELSPGQKAEFTSVVRSGGDGLAGGRTQNWSHEPGILRVAYGVQNRVDRIKRLGNGVVPECVREAFERLAGIA